MDVTAAEIKERHWAPRPSVGLALAVLAVLAGIAFAFIPFSVSQPKGASAVACGEALHAFRSYDPGPGLRKFLGAQPVPAKNAPPPAPGSLERLQKAEAATARYHTCHRPASVRMGISGLLILAGVVPLTRRRYRWPTERSATEADEDEARFLGGFGYQPALDGIRAIAISWVITTHLGLQGFFTTGDHGVDLFFVLSGFLITTLLLREHGRTGRINLGQFYIRRALRLLPVVLLAFAVGVAVQLIGPHWYRSPRWTGLFAMLFYFANWMHIHDVNALGIFTPTWSLSIEEQFYLLWPPIVVAVLALGQGRRQVALLAGYGAAAAAVYRFWSTSGYISAEYSYWYYNSFIRADALLTGCLLAALLSPAAVSYLRRRPQLVSRIALAGLAGVVLVCVKQTGINGHDLNFIPAWGLIALEISFALMICALVTLPTSRVAAALSIRPLVWLGRRSYGLYVIHLAIFTAVEQNNLVHARYPRMVVQVCLSLIAAALSYRFIEAPALRLKRRFGSKPI